MVTWNPYEAMPGGGLNPWTRTLVNVPLAAAPEIAARLLFQPHAGPGTAQAPARAAVARTAGGPLPDLRQLLYTARVRLDPRASAAQRAMLMVRFHGAQIQRAAHALLEDLIDTRGADTLRRARLEAAIARSGLRDGAVRVEIEACFKRWLAGQDLAGLVALRQGPLHDRPADSTLRLLSQLVDADMEARASQALLDAVHDTRFGKNRGPAALQALHSPAAEAVVVAGLTGRDARRCVGELLRRCTVERLNGYAAALSMAGGPSGRCRFDSLTAHLRGRHDAAQAAAADRAAVVEALQCAVADEIRERLATEAPAALSWFMTQTGVPAEQHSRFYAHMWSVGEELGAGYLVPGRDPAAIVLAVSARAIAASTGRLSAADVRAAVAALRRHGAALSSHDRPTVDSGMAQAFEILAGKHLLTMHALRQRLARAMSQGHRDTLTALLARTGDEAAQWRRFAVEMQRAAQGRPDAETLAAASAALDTLRAPGNPAGPLDNTSASALSLEQFVNVSRCIAGLRTPQLAFAPDVPQAQVQRLAGGCHVDAVRHTAHLVDAICTTRMTSWPAVAALARAAQAMVRGQQVFAALGAHASALLDAGIVVHQAAGRLAGKRPELYGRGITAPLGACYEDYAGRLERALPHALRVLEQTLASLPAAARTEWEPQAARLHAAAVIMTALGASLAPIRPSTHFLTAKQFSARWDWTTDLRAAVTREFDLCFDLADTAGRGTVELVPAGHAGRAKAPTFSEGSTPAGGA
jgi:hypothetical protein